MRRASQGFFRNENRTTGVCLVFLVAHSVCLHTFLRFIYGYVEHESQKSDINSWNS